jgi:hypothetical protein
MNGSSHSSPLPSEYLCNNIYELKCLKLFFLFATGILRGQSDTESMQCLNKCLISQLYGSFTQLMLADWGC